MTTNYRFSENAAAKGWGIAFALTTAVLGLALAFALACAQPSQAHAFEVDDAAAYDQRTSASGTIYLRLGDMGWKDVLLMSPVADQEIDYVMAVTASNANVNVCDFEPDAYSDPADRWFYEPSCSLSAVAIGPCTIRYQVMLKDGSIAEGSFQVQVYEVDLGTRAFANHDSSTSYYLLYKGAKAVKPQIKGVSGVKWATSNKAVAKVNSKGQITYAGLGSCTVQAIFGTVVVSIPVECTYKKAYKAVANGFADMNLKLTYDQGKRMKKNFRDCSSFVSRCYWDASLGRKLFAIGGASGKSWALPAAEQAKWLNGQKKCVAKKAVDPALLLAGDTVHTETQYAGQNNRYLHIDHVTMYVGNGMVLTTGGWSQTGGTVGLVGYYQDDPSVRFIGRPCAEPQMSVAKATLTKKKGREHTLQLKVQFQKGTVKWASSNKKVATVSSKGKVTAKKKGKTTITAKVAGKTFKCKITVK